jgi:hypothetical protein
MDEHMSTSTTPAAGDELPGFKPVMALKPEHQPSVTKIARAYYKIELMAAQHAQRLDAEIAALQATVMEESRKVGVPLSYLLGGSYNKDYAKQSDEGYLMTLGKAQEEAKCSAMNIAYSHKALTRAYCDAGVVEESGGK